MGQARELENKMTQAMLAGDLDTVRSCYAPDVVATTPDAGTLHGVDQVVDYLRQSIEGFSDMGWETTRELEAGNCAIDEGWQTGTHTGTLTERFVPGLCCYPEWQVIHSYDVGVSGTGLDLECHLGPDQTELVAEWFTGWLAAAAGSSPSSDSPPVWRRALWQVTQ